MDVSRLTDLAEILDTGEHPDYNEDDTYCMHDALSYLPQMDNCWRTIPSSNMSPIAEVMVYFDISHADAHRLFYDVPNLNNHRGTAGARAMAKIIYDYVAANRPQPAVPPAPQRVQQAVIDTAERMPSLHDQFFMVALGAMIAKLPLKIDSSGTLSSDAKHSVGTALLYANEAMKQRAARG